MSELKEIAALLFRNLSDALLATAKQLSDSKPFTKANLDTQIIEKPNLASLKVGYFVHISIIYRKQPSRGAGTITSIEGGKITVTNDVAGKEWVVAIENVLYLEVPSLRNR